MPARRGARHLTPMQKPPVVILNMHYTGLGIARNLAPLGVPLYALSSDRGFPGNYSRLVEFQAAPDSLNEPDQLEAFLLDMAKRLGDRPVLFPTRDHDIHFINSRRASLGQAFRIPFAGPEIMERVLDKDRTFEYAERCGISRPLSLTVRSLAELDAARERLRFPCIIKPLMASHWRKPGIWELVGRQKAVKIEDWDSLRRFYARIEAAEPTATVQEWIPGGEENLVVFGSYCRGKGEAVCWFTGRKRLQYPALYGTGVVVESHPTPAIEPISRRLLEALEFQGVSEIEYKSDPRDGSYRLIEVNPRHWDQHRLGTACGVNLSEAAYLDLLGEPPRPWVQQGPPKKWIAEYDLALYFLRCLAGRAGSLGDFFRLVSGPKVFAVWDRMDPQPGFRLLGSLVRGLLTLAKEGLAGAAGRRKQGPEGEG